MIDQLAEKMPGGDMNFLDERGVAWGTSRGEVA
jgi:hypothetical protein